MAKGSLELKVGAFLLVAVAILVAFIFILGNFDFSKGHALRVNFANTGGLRDGAKVKVAGVLAGRVQEILFLGGRAVNAQGKPIYVQVRLEVSLEMAPTLTEGSTFFISTEGLLGEKYIEISPGPPDARPIEEGAVVEGETPVELQVLSAKAAGMVDKLQGMVDGEGGEFKSVTDSLKETMERANRLATTLDEKLPGLVEESEATLGRARESLDRLDALMTEARGAISREGGANDAITHIASMAEEIDRKLPELIARIESLTLDADLLLATSQMALGTVDEEVRKTGSSARELIVQGKGLVRRADSVLTGADIPGAVADLRASLARLVEILDKGGNFMAGAVDRIEKLLDTTTEVVDAVRSGGGTLGALIKDRELYDDIRELVLDLKKAPWKAVWKQ